MFEKIKKFEKALSKFTNAPYVITTDCCTHAIELCLLHDNIQSCSFTAFTYLSIPQVMKKLSIQYTLTDERWITEYQFHNTRIWDCARRLEPNMYVPERLMCLSFGYGKPLDIGRGGAILTDSAHDYNVLSKMRYDGRDLSILPWESQEIFTQGYHYKLNPEECRQGLKKLKKYIKNKNFVSKTKKYPDCRDIKIL